MRAGTWGRAVVVGAAGAVVAAVGVTACGDEEARTCTERSGATFCLQRQGPSALEPTAEGLLPGSTLTFTVSGVGSGEPFTSAVGPTGVPDRSGVVGILDANQPVDLAGVEVAFTGTAADGTPVTATMTVGE